MNKKLFFVLSALTLILTSFSMIIAQEKPAQSPLGRFSALNGDISFSAGGVGEYVPTPQVRASSLELMDQDKILTGDQTTGEIKTNYGAAVKIEPKTELQLALMGIRINRGGTWINYKPVKDASGNMVFKVVTPTGTIGIKGTEFGVACRQRSKAGKTETQPEVLVQVRTGCVSFTHNSGKSVDIKAGQYISTTPDAPLGEPVQVKDGADMIQDSPAQDQENIDRTFDGTNQDEGLSPNTGYELDKKR